MKRNYSGFSRPKKFLSQNFLTDPRTAQKIIDACDLKATDSVVEIGPGRGVLTTRIAQNVKTLIAVEKDQQLAQNLRIHLTESNILIHEGDFLEFPLINAGQELKIIGNIPYYISTLIIEKIITERAWINSAFIMVQREFGDRLVAVPGSKDYGSLSCFVQYYCYPKVLLKIKNTCFTPKPKVHSSFIRMDIFKNPQLKARNEQLLFSLIRASFQQRRKTLRNALAPFLKNFHCDNFFEDLNIEPRLRAENISLENFIKMADFLDDRGLKNSSWGRGRSS